MRATEAKVDADVDLSNDAGRAVGRSGALYRHLRKPLVQH